MKAPILALALLTAGAALAQQPPRLERLEVVIWPEYDKPAVLVMLRAFLPATTPLPTTVPLPVPVVVGKPSAVAARSPGGVLANASWDFEMAGDWAKILVETPAPEVRVEYYESLDVSSPERRFRYSWPGGLEIDRVIYEVMEPVDSSGLTVTPANEPLQVGREGLTYQRGDLGPRAAGETFTLDVSYRKQGQRLTAVAMQGFPGPAQPAVVPGPAPGSASPDAPPAGGGSPLWPYAVVGALALGIFIGWLARRPASEAPPE